MVQSRFIFKLSLFAVALLLGLGYFMSSEPTQAANFAQIRVAHLAPFEEGRAPVVLKVNGIFIDFDFRYGESIKYVPVPAGHLRIELFDTGNHTRIFNKTYNVDPDGSYTAVAIGATNAYPLDVKLINETAPEPASGDGRLVLGHLAPFAEGLDNTTVDIRLQDGTVLVNDVKFDQTTHSTELPAGVYDLKITTPDGTQTLIDPEPIELGDGDMITALASGDGTNQDLAIFAFVNNKKGKFIAEADPARLYVAHLAPFASDAEVVVRVNGNDALTEFEYGDSTGYLEFEAGKYDIEILPAGTDLVAISGSVTLEPGLDYTAIAIGDGANRPLDLKAVVDNNEAPPAGQAKIRFGHLAPFADSLAGTEASICLDDGTPVLPNVRFGDIDTDYSIVLPAGTYDLQVATPDCSIALIDPEPVTVADGDILSVFATGEFNNQSLGVFAIVNGEEGAFLPLEAGVGRVYIAHLAPFAADASVSVSLRGPVNINIDEFGYGNYTGYLPVPSGNYDVELTPTGASSPAISGKLFVPSNADLTVAAIGDGVNQPLGLSVNTDNNSAPPAGKAKIRLGHLAPFAASLADTTADICLQDGTPVLQGVTFGTIDNSYSIELPAGTYDLKVTTPGCGETLIDPAPITLGDGDIVSAFATGEGANQTLAVYAIANGLAGQFIAQADPARLYVAHLAPFAADAEVSVTLNGATAIPSFKYGDSTGYLELEAGKYDVEIIPAGATEAAIAGTVLLETGLDYTAIAIGDGANQPLGLSALADDNSAPPAGFAKIRLGHLAPFADTLAGTEADICLQDGTPVLQGVRFGDIDRTYSVVLPAGETDLKVTTPGCGDTLIDPVPVTLADQDILSIYATGEGANQALGIFATINAAPGVFLELESAELQVVHLAPFASNPADTAVDVDVNKERALTGLIYGETSEIFSVRPGDTLIDVFPSGSNQAVIMDNIDLELGTKTIYTVIGNGTTQPIEPVVVTIASPQPGMALLNFGHMMSDPHDTVDLRDSAGNIVMDDVTYGEMMSLDMMPGTYDFDVTSADGTTVLVDLNQMTMAAGEVMTIMTMFDMDQDEMSVMAMNAAGTVTDTTGYTLFLPFSSR